MWRIRKLARRVAKPVSLVRAKLSVSGPPEASSTPAVIQFKDSAVSKAIGDEQLQRNDDDDSAIPQRHVEAVDDLDIPAGIPESHRSGDEPQEVKVQDHTESVGAPEVDGESIVERATHELHKDGAQEDVTTLRDGNEATSAYDGQEVATPVELVSSPCDVDQAEAEAAAREAVYIYFDVEESSDYTDGPARLVNAVDGVKDCTALLMTMELSAMVQKAVQAQRAYDAAAALTLEKRVVNSRFESKLRQSIRAHERRILQLEKSDGAEAADGVAGLQDEAGKLQLLLANTEAAQQGSKARLGTQADNLRKIQANLTACMEEALVHANIIEPAPEQPIPEVPDLDVEQEYQRLCKAIQEDEGLETASAPSLRSCGERLQPRELDPEEQNRADLINAYHTAHNRAAVAEQAFDDKYDVREAEWQASYEAAVRGEVPQDATPEVFDLRWFVKIQDITREFADAQDAFAEAKAALVAAGIQMEDADRASGFVDDVEDGYRLSFEDDLIASTSRPLVDKWLGSIDSEADPDVELSTVVERDGWDAKSVEIGDSWSCVDFDADGRRRIRQWREVCGR
ncbi:hypothetical protein LTR53_004422 [Teratosphaeriaceae sp. CCFEE 6253]|nr:hypothetical protein LTR53_004422 [Teratosphaeriaceae sp. CCFEE 6253]